MVVFVKTKDEIAKEVDDLSNNLIDEFFSHYKEVCDLQKIDLDQRKVFEGWIIQKIAGLQLMIYRFNDELNKIKEDIKELS